MLVRHKSLVRMAFAGTAALVLAGCGSTSSTSASTGSSFGLSKVKETIVGSSQPEPNLPDRAPLMAPSNTSVLPEPGSGQNTQAWQPSVGANDGNAKKQATAGSTNSSCQNQNASDSFSKSTMSLGCP